MNFKITLLVILICGNLQSQNITTEFEFIVEDFSKANVNYLSSNVDIHVNCYSSLIKADVTKNSFNTEFYFTLSIFKFLTNGTLKAYNLSDNSLIPPEHIRSYFETLDTITTFDPETYEPRISYEKNLNLISIAKYKFKQSWKFVNNKIEFKIDGIIPIQTIRGRSKELMYIENNHINIDSLINNSNISWIKLNEDYIQIPEKVKEDKNFKMLIWEQPKNRKTSVYAPSINIFHNNQIIADSIIDNIFYNSFIDTVKTYDPETFEATIEIVHSSPMKYSELKFLKINQVWFINEENGYVGSKLIGISPLILSENRLKEKYFYPLYYIELNKLK